MAAKGQDKSWFPRMTRRVGDSLASLMSGSGTTVDPRTGYRWLLQSMPDIEIEAAYCGSWLMKKIVDLPAYDMTRAWRDWQAEDDQIAKIEAEEQRLRVKEKIRMGIILGRLGGGALIMGNGRKLSEPIDPASIQERGLKYLFVAPRSQLKANKLIDDPESDNFGEPETFDLTLPGNKTEVVHESRMLIFKGQFRGNLTSHARSTFWGDSIVQIVDDAVTNATIAQNEFASLIIQAKIDIYKMPGLMANAANAEYEKRFTRRFELANVAKSNFRALILDKDEEWEQRQLDLIGMPEMIRAYIEIVAGAADIPATRLFGKSPDGMNATGESDQSNYDQMVRTRQENELRPILEKLDEILLPSAGVQTGEGIADAANDSGKGQEIYFEFAPLNVMGEKEASEVEKREAETLKSLTDTGLFEEDALEEAFSNRMVESGRWPGYEKARQKALVAAAKKPSETDVAGVSQPGPPGTGTDPQPPSGAPGTSGTPTVHVHVGGPSSATG
jgi:phage-related protein (TIGR01555 family)